MMDDFAWAACSISAWTRATISSGSDRVPSRTSTSDQSCRAH